MKTAIYRIPQAYAIFDTAVARAATRMIRQLWRQIVPHAIDDSDLSARDFSMQIKRRCDADQRIVAAVDDHGRSHDAREQRGAITVCSKSPIFAVQRQLVAKRAAPISRRCAVTKPDRADAWCCR